MRKKKTCSDCGFLSWNGKEIGRASRIMLDTRFQAGAFSEVEAVGCSRRLWTDALYYGGKNAETVFEEIERDRNACEGFLGYRPGWSPDEHKELIRGKDVRKERIFLVLLTVVGGSVTALLMDILLKVFKLPF
jgi:hypothetical protein